MFIMKVVVKADSGRHSVLLNRVGEFFERSNDGPCDKRTFNHPTSLLIVVPIHSIFGMPFIIQKQIVTHLYTFPTDLLPSHNPPYIFYYIQ
jgi:hypothetical protein